MEKIERGEKAGPFWGKRRPLAPCQARGSGEGEDKKGQLKAVKSREVGGGAEGLCTLKRGTRPPTLSPMAAAPKFPVLFCQAEAAAQPWAGWKRSLGGDMLLLLFAFSGFGPFGEHTVNASWIAVQVTQMWRVGIRLRAGLPLEIDGTKERKEHEENGSLEASRKTFKSDTPIFPNGDRCNLYSLACSAPSTPDFSHDLCLVGYIHSCAHVTD